MENNIITMMIMMIIVQIQKNINICVSKINIVKNYINIVKNYIDLKNKKK